MSAECICPNCDKRHFSPSKKSNPLQIVKNFHSAIMFHHHLEQMFPVEHPELTEDNPKEGQRSYYNRLVVAASLRKFVALENDSVYLPNVATALRSFGQITASDDELANYEETFRAIKAKRFGLQKVKTGSGKALDPWRIVESELYGGFLHLDSRKNSAKADWTIPEKEMALMHWASTFTHTLFHLEVHAHSLLFDLNELPRL